MNNDSSEKFSKSFLMLKTLIDIENREGKALDTDIQDRYNEIKYLYNDFYKGFPLIIIEKALKPKLENFNPEKYVYMEYNGNMINENIKNLILKLEDFYDRIFFIAVVIGSYYNIESRTNQVTAQNMADFDF